MKCLLDVNDNLKWKKVNINLSDIFNFILSLCFIYFLAFFYFFFVSRDDGMRMFILYNYLNLESINVYEIIRGCV